MCLLIATHATYKVVQIWPGRFVCKQVTVCPGNIWTTLHLDQLNSHCHAFYHFLLKLLKQQIPVIYRRSVMDYVVWLKSVWCGIWYGILPWTQNGNRHLWFVISPPGWIWKKHQVEKTLCFRVQLLTMSNVMWLFEREVSKWTQTEQNNNTKKEVKKHGIYLDKQQQKM
jgi:hypothetical protein